MTDISREAAERAAASQEGSGHGLSGGEDAISSYFSRFDMFRELISQISAFAFTVTKKLYGAFELNKQPGWRMELNTIATAVPLPIFVQPRILIPQITEAIVNCESGLGLWAAPLLAVPPYFFKCSRLNSNLNANSYS